MKLYNFLVTEIIHAARDKKNDLERKLKELSIADTTPTCFRDALVATVTHDTMEMANMIVCHVAKNFEDPKEKLDLRHCVQEAFQNGCTELAAMFFVCFLISGDHLHVLQFLFCHQHDNTDFEGLFSDLVPSSLNYVQLIEELR